MWSVICPTMWLGRELEYMLPLIDQQSAVGEILIIDNAPASRPDWFRRDWTKVRLLEQSTNISVNPAWNLGAAEAKHDQLCFLSDDVIFDEAVFGWLVLSNVDGIVGLDKRCVLRDRPAAEVKSPKMSLLPITDYRVYIPLGFGCLMFCHKAAYVPIPEQLKTWYGDEWLYYHSMRRACLNQCASMMPKFLEDFRWLTTPATTSKHHGGSFKTEESIWMVLMPRIG